MSLLPICESPLIFDPKDSVSKLSAKMFDKKKHEAIVLDKNNYLGMVFARDLVKRKINKPEKTEIKKFVTNINPISFETSPEDVINTVMVNDFKSVPIKKGNNFLVLTKLSLLNSIKDSESFRGKKLEDVMVFPYCVSDDDSIATAMSVLRQTGVSRLPVLNKNSEIEGLVDTLDLLKANISRVRLQKGERLGDKIKKREALISSLTRKNTPTLSPKDSVKKSIEEMVKTGISTVLVKDKKKLVGIITPKMILKLFSGDVSGVLVTLSGIKDEDPFIKSVVDEEVSNSVKKLNKIIRIEHLIVHIDKHHKTGDRVKYSVKARLMTEKGMFFANDFAWDLTKAIGGMIHKVEKEMIKKKSKNTYKRLI
ncbi:MAG: CBS domain-containing protein [Nanoarchaeota archaeon]|nr:CBS domain-containing protein [Nanoarchaeota archaeon]MBU1135310.1 CBS domain-containing protein [Nanoarchaeota archaeon]MBU2520036.1 CBS domain-containing protein [Nanoarchaeota archaeon]